MAALAATKGLLTPSASLRGSRSSSSTSSSSSSSSSGRASLSSSPSPANYNDPTATATTTAATTVRLHRFPQASHRLHPMSWSSASFTVRC